MNDTPYFITAAIYNKQPLLLNYIKSNFSRYQWELHHWVILDNHYHLLGKSRKGRDLTNIIKQIHSVSGFHIKKATQAQQSIWWNYWDYFPRNEEGYLMHLNYLFNNPIKHHYIDNLQDYFFSSFHLYMESQGREKIVKQFKEYPEYKTLYLDEDNF